MSQSVSNPAQIRLPFVQEGSRPVGAIVVGGDYQGLGIVRSLGRRGIPICVVDDQKSIARFSRYTRHHLEVPSLRGEHQAIEALITAERQFGLTDWVVFPTRDETVAALARNRFRLCQQFRIPTPAWEIVKWAWDKRNTYRLAEDLGIATPRTWYVKHVDELEQVSGSPPFAVKPTVKDDFFYATKAKAWRANTKSELRALFLKAHAVVGPGEVMVQDLIPGDGDQQLAYCAFFKEGRAIGKMVVRRRRQHPPEFGRASTLVETIELPLLEELSERLLRKIGYYGLVELEYKLDPRDGQYRLLDFNARTWGYHSLGQAAGVDFPYLLFADQVGRTPPECRSRAGVRWIRLVTDVPTGISEILRGRQDWRSYVGSVSNFDVESSFSYDDSLPGIAELALFPYLCLKRGF